MKNPHTQCKAAITQGLHDKKATTYRIPVVIPDAVRPQLVTEARQSFRSVSAMVAAILTERYANARQP